MSERPSSSATSATSVSVGTASSVLDDDNAIFDFDDDEPKHVGNGKDSESVTSSDDSLFLVPKNLIEEEEKVKESNKEEEALENAKSQKDVADLSRKERYEKLMELLGKSKFYSDYLKEKIEEEDEAKELTRKKIQDRKKIKDKLIKEAKKRKSAVANQPPSKRLKHDIARFFEGKNIPDEQPLLLSGGVMRDYQLQGFMWVATLFENGINGILADEMGLGKTIQTIAVFCHLVEMGIAGPFLIVAPLSTITNWVNEFKRFAPLFPTVLYHGSRAEREELRRKELPKTHHIETIDKKIRSVFITSYEIVIRDRPFLSKVEWRYLVVDEGHRLKNTDCRLIKELRQYTSINRLLLTGTPLQNNLKELWSLLNFIMPEIFDNYNVFDSWFDARVLDESESESQRILLQEQQENILSTLHQILTPFLLRRVKSDVDLKIPPKKEVLVYCPMTQRQLELYEGTVNRTIQDLVGSKSQEPEENLGKGQRKKATVDYSVFLDSDGKSDKKLDAYFKKISEFQKNQESFYNTPGAYGSNQLQSSDVRLSLKNRMMDLRKTANHPYLIEYPLTEDGLFYKTDEEIVENSGKLKVLDQMLKALLDRKHKVLIFSQMTRMMDILGDYLNLREHKFSRLDGSMAFEERQLNIDQFNSDPNINIFLLSTRAGGLGINLTAADTCIIYDSDWNPQQDLQAQDRCHRIGQTKPVMVYRLVTANTLDQKIVERAAAKRKLEKMIIHSKKFKSQDTEGLKRTIEAISPQELLDLLQSKDHSRIVERKDGSVFTSDELDMLLDRSDLSWDAKAKEDLKKGKNRDKAKRTQGPDSSGLFKVIETEGIPSSEDLKIKKED